MSLRNAIIHRYNSIFNYLKVNIMNKKLTNNQLLTREQFRDYSLKRDIYSCVFCKSKVNIVVHHILDRKLFSDGGYYLDNGASVCDEYHWECEKTDISVETVSLYAFNSTN